MSVFQLLSVVLIPSCFFIDLLSPRVKFRISLLVSTIYALGSWLWDVLKLIHPHTAKEMFGTMRRKSAEREYICQLYPQKLKRTPEAEHCYLRCYYYVSMCAGCAGAYVEVEENVLGVCSLLPPLCNPKIELRSPGLCDKQLYLLSHLTSPRIFLEGQFVCSRSLKSLFIFFKCLYFLYLWRTELGMALRFSLVAHFSQYQKHPLNLFFVKVLKMTSSKVLIFSLLCRKNCLP